VQAGFRAPAPVLTLCYNCRNLDTIGRDVNHTGG